MYDKINNVFRAVYALLSTILAWATEEHTQELKQSIVQKLDMLSAHVSELIDEKIETTVLPKIFNAYLCLSLEDAQITDHEDGLLEQLQIKGNPMGIKYQDEQPVVKVQFLDTGDPQHVCWQDHGLPADLCAALGIDTGHFAPTHLPLEMVETLKEKDTLVIEAANNVEIHLYVWQGATGGGEGFEQVLPKVCRSGFMRYKYFATAVTATHIDKYLFGLCYLLGLGTPKNQDAAIEWFHKAADEGNHRAQVRLGEG